jgi:hypothetical protein
MDLVSGTRVTKVISNAEGSVFSVRVAFPVGRRPASPVRLRPRLSLVGVELVASVPARFVESCLSAPRAVPPRCASHSGWLRFAASEPVSTVHSAPPRTSTQRHRSFKMSLLARGLYPTAETLEGWTSVDDARTWSGVSPVAWDWLMSKACADEAPIIVVVALPVHAVVDLIRAWIEELHPAPGLRRTGQGGLDVQCDTTHVRPRARRPLASTGIDSGHPTDSTERADRRASHHGSQNQIVADHRSRQRPRDIHTRQRGAHPLLHTL